MQRASQNRNNDEKDSVPIVDARILSQFENDKKGMRVPYSEVMQNYRPGSLMYKHKPMPKQKRFGVLETDNFRKSQNKTVNEMSKGGVESTKGKEQRSKNILLT